MRIHHITFYLILCVAVGQLAAAEPVLQPGDRIVFVGDSITGQGGKGEQGWVALIGRALKEADPANHQTLVPLGGSGQTVGSWGSVERQSREKAAFLDVKQYNVRTELDQPADIVVIMLGMNDVLAPQIKDEPASYAKWVEDYRSLIHALRDRAKPRVLALATPTPCTEDPNSPKNRVLDKLVEHLQQLAADEHCLVLPTRATAWEVLATGRKLKPDFHITGDQVHPNGPGHRAIAAGMLRGLGADNAARSLVQQALPVPDRMPVSYIMARAPEGDTAKSLRFRLTVFAGDKVTLDLPASWTVTDEKAAGPGQVLVVDASPDQLVNKLTLHCGTESVVVTIPAPWLVGTGNIGWGGWKAGVFDAAAGKLPADEIVRSGQGFKEAMSHLELKAGQPVGWKPFVGSVNYGGGGSPEVLDFAGVTYFTGGEVGYGLRWIHSDQERPVTVKILRSGFAGNHYLQVWLNGARLYAAAPAAAAVPAKLQAGWNLLSFKSNFAQWQWQFGIALEPVGDDRLADLRYRWIPAE